MKKYLLPLIFIFVLLFVSVDDCAWLSGYDKRIGLTIDNTKVDAALSYFPVVVNLTSTQGEEVFTELTADAEFIKVAFTKADGTTELYAEKEWFSIASELGLYYVSRDGWAISNSADTIFYMYYDKDHADNTTYIGAIGARTEVWDANHKMVYHMTNLTSSTVEDSTSNSNDGTKTGVDAPNSVAGKVGNAQNYDAHVERIYTSSTIAAMSNFTFETLVKYFSDVGGTDDKIFATSTGYNDPSIFRYTDEKIYVYADGSEQIASTNTIADSNWHHVAVVADGTYIRLYIDGTEDGSSPVSYTGNSATDTTVNVGDNSLGSDTFLGIIDESRVSDTNRSAAWLKATYNTLYDTLLTYGSEESAPSGITWNAVTISKFNTKTISKWNGM